MTATRRLVSAQVGLDDDPLLERVRQSLAGIHADDGLDAAGADDDAFFGAGGGLDDVRGGLLDAVGSSSDSNAASSDSSSDGSEIIMFAAAEPKV